MRRAAVAVLVLCVQVSSAWADVISTRYASPEIVDARRAVEERLKSLGVAAAGARERAARLLEEEVRYLAVEPGRVRAAGQSNRDEEISNDEKMYYGIFFLAVTVVGTGFWISEQQSK